MYTSKMPTSVWAPLGEQLVQLTRETLLSAEPTFGNSVSTLLRHVPSASLLPHADAIIDFVCRPDFDFSRHRYTLTDALRHMPRSAKQCLIRDAVGRTDAFVMDAVPQLFVPGFCNGASRRSLILTLDPDFVKQEHAVQMTLVEQLSDENMRVVKEAVHFIDRKVLLMLQQDPLTRPVSDQTIRKLLTIDDEDILSLGFELLSISMPQDKIESLTYLMARLSADEYDTQRVALICIEKLISKHHETEELMPTLIQHCTVTSWPHVLCILQNHRADMLEHPTPQVVGMFCRLLIEVQGADTGDQRSFRELLGSALTVLRNTNEGVMAHIELLFRRASTGSSQDGHFLTEALRKEVSGAAIEHIRDRRAFFVRCLNPDAIMMHLDEEVLTGHVTSRLAEMFLCRLLHQPGDAKALYMEHKDEWMECLLREGHDAGQNFFIYSLLVALPSDFLNADRAESLLTLLLEGGVSNYSERALFNHLQTAVSDPVLLEIHGFVMDGIWNEQNSFRRQQLLQLVRRLCNTSKQGRVMTRQPCLEQLNDLDADNDTFSPSDVHCWCEELTFLLDFIDEMALQQSDNA
jgi:hypothetical protein